MYTLTLFSLGPYVMEGLAPLQSTMASAILNQGLPSKMGNASLPECILMTWKVTMYSSPPVLILQSLIILNGVNELWLAMLMTKGDGPVKLSPSFFNYFLFGLEIDLLGIERVLV